jgi:plastocyanin
MRVRNVTTVLGLGAFVLVCLAPESAQAQRRMGWGRGGAGYYPADPAVYGQSWQPGYYGAPSYWPGTAYGPGLSYAAPMYQPQPYTYPPSAAPCPPAQPIAPSALTSAPPQAMPSAAPGAAPGQPAATLTVGAHDDYFEPKTLNIQPGATVTWVNRGQHPHTVTFDVGRDSGDIAPGGSFSATFPHAGTYHYHCHHHEGMTGTVVVGEGSGTGAAGGGSGARY